jgi:hypothetical protein
LALWLWFEKKRFNKKVLFVRFILKKVGVWLKLWLKKKTVSCVWLKLWLKKNNFLCLVNMLCVLGLILELLKRT